MFSQPIMNVQQAAGALEVSFNTADALIQLLVKAGILREITGLSRNRLFVLYTYLDLFKK